MIACANTTPGQYGLLLTRACALKYHIECISIGGNRKPVALRLMYTLIARVHSLSPSHINQHAAHSRACVSARARTDTRAARAGSRLTAYELVHDGLPATLVADSAAGALLAAGRVDAVVTGADRVAANGDTANKIGTLSLAVNAARCGRGPALHLP